MSLTITTNHVSNIVQKNLACSTARLNSAIEKLTTGFKINHAGDNAAGYSISTQYSSKLSSYQIAQSNTAMGMDLLTTAEENLNLVTSHLSRMRDLAEQASNGIYGKDSLNAIQAEFNIRIDEIRRIISNAEYNGIKLFKEPIITNDEEVAILTEEEALAQGYSIIKTADQLQAMKNNLGGKYILMKDIDLSGYNWDVVGNINNPFTGELNGNGHSITNLILNRDTYDYVGLIGRMEGGKITNLGLEDAEVNGKMWVGAIAGYSYNSTISNCFVAGRVSGYSDVGAVAGSNIYSSVVKDCYSLASVSADDYRAGGLVGHNTDNSTITNSFSKGDVSGNTSVGGLVGQNSQGSISKSYSSGSVTGNSNTAGFLGWNDNGTLNTCYWDTQKSGQTGGVGLGNAAGVTGVTSAELKELILSGMLPGAALLQPQINTEIYFQVGINSGMESQIMIDTAFDFSISGMAISSSESARKALNRIDSIMSVVSSKQTEIGSVYNRLESALESISVSVDNITSSLSTMRDADIGEVSSEYIRNQILQQASATLLSTANQAPAAALQLL